jgi:Tfp pilus assembly protein PilX
MRRTHNNQRGAALITTLVAIAIVGVLMAAVGNLVIGHNVRARTDQDAAKALNLAEAALNYQVHRITSTGLSGTQVKYNGSTGSWGVPPSVATWPVPKWDLNPGTAKPLPVPANLITVGTKNLHPYLNLTGVNTGDGTGDVWVSWVSPDLNLYDGSGQDLYGAATVNGITRVVRGKGGAVGIFDKNALFSMTSLSFRGNLYVNGTIGTNGRRPWSGAPPSWKPSSNTERVAPPQLATVTPLIPAPTQYPNEQVWPTITSIADGVAQALTTYTGGDKPAYYSGIPTTNGILDFSANNDNSLGTYQADKIPVTPLPTNGNITTTAKTIRLVGKPWGANYYLTDFGGNVDIAADISGGPVTLWINVSPASTSPININSGSRVRAYNATTNPTVSDALLVPVDALKFKIYYRNTTVGSTLKFLGPRPVVRDVL